MILVYVKIPLLWQPWIEVKNNFSGTIMFKDCSIELPLRAGLEVCNRILTSHETATNLVCSLPDRVIHIHCSIVLQLAIIHVLLCVLCREFMGRNLSPSYTWAMSYLVAYGDGVSIRAPADVDVLSPSVHCVGSLANYSNRRNV